MGVDPTTVSREALLAYARSLALDLRVMHALDGETKQRVSACKFTGPDGDEWEVYAEPGQDVSLAAYRAVCKAHGVDAEEKQKRERSLRVQEIVDAAMIDPQESRRLAREYARGTHAAHTPRRLAGKFNVR
ncbi:MAG TPA: hypothetical protein VMN56_03535 [Casimicrobiaceae bacterium]|nr:hypothetical protein [Casimicrobiaceae bacterium]